MKVLLNGKLIDESKAHISIYDHGFLYGDGIYETIRVYGGTLFQLNQHLRRLKNSAKGIKLKVPVSYTKWKQSIARLLTVNKLKEATVRLMVTRGPGPLGFDVKGCHHPTWLITTHPVRPYSSFMYSKGITCAVVSVRRNSPLSLPPWTKSNNCLNGILAKLEANKQGAEEGLFLSLDGSVAEGTVSNLFGVKHGKIITPKLDGGILPGTIRNWVLTKAKQKRRKTIESKITVSQLFSFDELFITNSLIHIVPVHRLKAPNRSPKIFSSQRPITHTLMAELDSKISQIAASRPGQANSRNDKIPKI